MHRHLRNLFLVTFLASTPWSVALAQEAKPDVQWRYDYNAARKEAKEKGLPLLLDFYTDDCVYCVKMDQSTFKNPKVVGLVNGDFIAVKVHGERESFLTSNLGITAFPTFVFASAEGKILNRVVGFEEATKFQESMQRVIAQVSEPEWMKRDLQLAERAVGIRDYPRAIAMLKTIVEDNGTRASQVKAQKILEEIDGLAKERFAKIKDQVEKGQATESIEPLTDLLRTFPGLAVAKEAGDYLGKVAQSPDLKRQQRSKRAQELLVQAQDFFKGKDYIPCLDRCEILMAGYGDLAEGVEAAQLVAHFKNDPEWLQNACDTLGDRLGGLYLALADSLLKKGQSDRAKFYLERVIRGFPGTRQAESAQIRLGQLQGVPATQVDVQIERPAMPRPPELETAKTPPQP